MRRLSVFNSVTADGYFTGDKGDLSWAHKMDPEWNSFIAENSESEGQLLFGRVTYEMMASFWPTPAAAQAFPTVAEQMNKLSKVVFSKSLDKVTWNNTHLLKGDLIEEVRKLKESEGPHLVIMGSGTIVSQLTQARLIDEYQIVFNPIVLGSGRTMFEGLQDKLNLKVIKTRAFQNGNVLVCYEPQA
jgi:dihydrofolate reductase